MRLVTPIDNLQREDRAAHFVRFAVAALLLVAAALKAHQVATEPVLDAGILTSRWFLIASVEFELFLVLWLLSGLYCRLSWAVTLGCFVVFLTFSLLKGLAGETSCGCFGRVPVNPWLTMLLDLGVVVALIACQPSQGEIKSSNVSASTSRSAIQLIRPLVVFLIIGVPVGIVMATFRPTTLSDSGLLVGSSRVVLLEPEKWTGRRFPLLNHVNVASSLRHGRWLVLLYHEDCAKCQEILPRYQRWANTKTGEESSLNFALIELPPFQADNDRVDSACLYGRLSDQKAWFVTTPAEILLEDGTVTRVFSDGRGIRWFTECRGRNVK